MCKLEERPSSYLLALVLGCLRLARLWRPKDLDVAFYQSAFGSCGCERKSHCEVSDEIFEKVR